MYCPRCGSINRDGSEACRECGRSFSKVRAGPVPRVPNNMIWAIATTLCCCLPAGIVSIVFAAQSSGKLQVGDYLGAMEKYRLSRLWTWIAVGLGLGVVLVQLGLVLLSQR